MGFFSRKEPESKDDSISTAEWQSLASGGGNSSSVLRSVRDNDSGFVNPEGPMALGESAWAQERRSQQLELEDVHHRRKKGCCSEFMSWVIKGLHAINLCLGITLLVYGSLLKTQFEQPAMAAVLFCLLLGTVLLVSSSVGIFSYASPSCSRWGLLVSGFVAPYLSVIYVTMIIALCMDSSGLFMYLEDHHEVMYLSEDVVKNLEDLMPLVYSILGMLAGLELARTFVTLNTRKTLMSASSAEALIPRSGYTSVSSPPDTLKEPLLEEKVSSSYAPSDNDGEQKKEVAETPDWWKG